VALNKQTLLFAFCSLILALWIIKIISSGKLKIVWSKLCLAMLLLVLVLGISTAFSLSRVQSFWGQIQEADTFLNFILYTLVFFFFASLLMNTDDNQINTYKRIKNVVLVFLMSSGLLAGLFLVQSFWKPIFPWDFTKVSAFNPIGSVQALGIFLGGAFVILMTFLINISISKPDTQAKGNKLVQVLLGILGLALFVVLFLINYWVIWLGIVFCTTIIIWGKLRSLTSSVSDKKPSQEELANISAEQPNSEEMSVSKETKKLKGFLLPMIVLMIALILIFVKLPQADILNISPEVSPTYKASFDIAKKTLGEGAKNFVLGSGPATFGLDYSLHRTSGANLTDFWSVRFNQGAALFPTFLATFGILGILAALSMLGIFFYRGLRNLISIESVKEGESDNGNQRLISGIQLATFIGGFYFFISWLFYPANFSLIFAGFLMIGLWVASTARDKDIKKFSFTQSPQKAFFIMLGSVILIAGIVIGCYNIGRKYVGALAYVKGVSLLNAETPDLDQGITSLVQATTLDKNKDIYFRALSQVLLSKTNEILNNKELSDEQRQEMFQQAVSGAEIFAGNAVQINSKDSLNFMQLGSFYENVIPFVDDAEGLAITNYKEAQALDPQNPQILLNLGRVYIAASQKINTSLALLAKAEERDKSKEAELKKLSEQNLDKALEEFEKSIKLKGNFTPAYYLIAYVYETKGEKDKALQGYRIVLELEPMNKEVQEKIKNLAK